MRTLIAIALCSILGALAVQQGALADNFVDARYDPSTDELVVTMRYSGTLPASRAWRNAPDKAAAPPSHSWSGNYDLIKASRSALMASACVVHMPCGKPL